MIRGILSLLFAFAFSVRGAQLNINIGGASNDGTGDSIRSAYNKVNTNFSELYGSLTQISANSISAAVSVGVPTSLTVFNVKGYATPGDGGGGLFYWDSSSTTATNRGYARAIPYGASSGRIIRISDGVANVRASGALGASASEDTAAIQEAINYAKAAGGGDVRFPRGHYLVNSTLIIDAPGIRLIGDGATEKWGQGVTNRPTCIVFSGTNSCIKFVGPVQGDVIRDIQLDGFNSSGNTDGLYFDGVSECTNMRLVDCTFSDFPRYQVYAPVALSGLWGITFARCNFHNRGRTASNLVQFDGTTSTMAELTFDDCIFQNFTANTWCAKITSTSIRFIGGTVSTVGDNHGVWGRGGLGVDLTHFEGAAATTNSIGIRIEGSLGHDIRPALVSGFTTGIQIGDPAAPTGFTEYSEINGTVGGNTVDVHVVSGGSRYGTHIARLGRFGGSPVVQDDRKTMDGVGEVKRTDLDSVIFPDGSLAMPTFTFILATNTGMSRAADGSLQLGVAGVKHLSMLGGASTMGELTATTNFVQLDAGIHSDRSQFRVSLGGKGGVSVSAYETNNAQISFDSELLGLAWKARSDSAFVESKGPGYFTWSGNTGLTYGATFVPTTLMSFDLSNGSLAIGGITGGKTVADPSAILDLTSTNRCLVPPRMTKTQRNAISSPPEGGVINQTDNTPGPRWYVGGAWQKVALTADP